MQGGAYKAGGRFGGIGGRQGRLGEELEMKQGCDSWNEVRQW